MKLRLSVSLCLACWGWAGTFGTVVPIGGQASDLALDEARGVEQYGTRTKNRT